MKGFTLIELLIVIAIITVLTSLVGPFAFSALEKAQAKQELLTFQNMLVNTSHQAYFKGTPVEVVLDGKLVTVNGKSENDRKTIVLEYLFFEPQTVRYNAKGFVANESLSAVHRGDVMEINLQRLVNRNRTALEQ